MAQIQRERRSNKKIKFKLIDEKPVDKIKEATKYRIQTEYGVFVVIGIYGKLDNQRIKMEVEKGVREKIKEGGKKIAKEVNKLKELC